MPRKYKTDGEGVALEDLAWKSRKLQGKVFLERPDGVVPRTSH